VVGRIRSVGKPNELIGNRTRDLPACSIVPQATTLPRTPEINTYVYKNPGGDPSGVGVTVPAQ
jgi:hypothetical protein